jgi:CheY-like chemotaxis protein
MTEHTGISEGALRGWNALVIDDDEISREIAVDTLLYYGAAVHAAIDGKDGLDKARTHQPDFIIADIRMPVMDGWSMIKALKEDIHTQNIPVIALTAHAMDGERDRAISEGFHYHLTKPIDPLTLVEKILVFVQDMKPRAIPIPIDALNSKAESTTGS